MTNEEIKALVEKLESYVKWAWHFKGHAWPGSEIWHVRGAACEAESMIEELRAALAVARLARLFSVQGCKSRQVRASLRP